jgi:hypothetical protein
MFRCNMTMIVTVIAAALVLLTGSGMVSGAEPPRPAQPAAAPVEAGARGEHNLPVAKLAEPGAALDDTTLGQIAGGARLSAPFDNATGQLATIKLWDEGRTRLITGTDQGGGLIVVTVTATQVR